MSYKWYKLMNTSDLSEHDLVSKEYNYFLEEKGEIQAVLYKGNLYSLLIDGVFISDRLNDRIPFYFEDRAIAINSSGDVWYGVLSDN